MIDKVATVGSRYTHLSMKVSTAWELLKQGKNVFDEPVSVVTRDLNAQTKAGKEYITGCDNEKPNGMCGGHAHAVEVSTK